MIDFTRQPKPKSDAEITFDRLNDEYETKYGVPYVFAIGLNSMSWEEAIADIRRRIDENDPQQNPDYESGNVY